MGKLIVLMALLAVGGWTEEIPLKTIATVKKAAVPLVCSFRDSNNRTQLVGTAGSGFFVNKEGYLVTAAHVIEALQRMSTPERQCSSAIYVSLDGWAITRDSGGVNIRILALASCQVNRGLDIAVCRPTNNPFESSDLSRYIDVVRFDSFFRQRDGTPVAFTGFPLSSARPITSQGFIASYRSVEKELVIDRNAWPGASGSAIYLKNGRLVGMLIQAGFDRAAGLAYGRPADFIADFLREQKVRFD